MADPKVVTNSYLDTDGNIRTLVSIYNGNEPVQTIGSWLTTDDALPHVITACVRTLNAIKDEG